MFVLHIERGGGVPKEWICVIALKITPQLGEVTKYIICILHFELFHAIAELLGIGVIFVDTLSKN